MTSDASMRELGEPRYRTMTDAERQAQYSPSSAIGGDYAPFIEQYELKSQLAYEACLNVTTVSYGDLPSTTFDIAVPAEAASGTAAAPLVVYLHGGYWQALSKQQSFFGANEFVDRGVAYAAVDYTLAPAATLDQIVNECRVALTSISTNAAELGVDASRIYLVGSSAGAHLSALCANGTGDFHPAGVILLSGIYDLEPFVGISDNEAVGLDVAEAKRLSPLLRPTLELPDTIITWGEHETDEFKRQSQTMGHKLAVRGRRVEMFESPARNHFDVVHDLVDMTTPLGHQVNDLIGRSS